MLLHRQIKKTGDIESKTPNISATTILYNYYGFSDLKFDYSVVGTTTNPELYFTKFNSDVRALYIGNNYPSPLIIFNENDRNIFTIQLTNTGSIQKFYHKPTKVWTWVYQPINFTYSDIYIRLVYSKNEYGENVIEVWAKSGVKSEESGYIFDKKIGGYALDYEPGDCKLGIGEAITTTKTGSTTFYNVGIAYNTDDLSSGINLDPSLCQEPIYFHDGIKDRLLLTDDMIVDSSGFNLLSSSIQLDNRQILTEDNLV